MPTLFNIGDRGLAGGYIFYDCDADNDSGNFDGLKSIECGWRYLEAAPTDITDDSGKNKKLYVSLHSGSDKTKEKIGTGKSNMMKLVERYNGYHGGSAASACSEYSITVNGELFNDWFIPSKDELNLMYKNLFKKGLGNFKDTFDYMAYMSSSAYKDTNQYGGTATRVYFMHFGGEDEGQDGYGFSYDYYGYVRPIMAF